METDGFEKVLDLPALSPVKLRAAQRHAVGVASIRALAGLGASQ